MTDFDNIGYYERRKLMKALKKSLPVFAIQFTGKNDKEIRLNLKTYGAYFVETPTGFSIAEFNGYLDLTPGAWLVYGKLDRSLGVVQDDIFKLTYEVDDKEVKGSYRKKPLMVDYLKVSDFTTATLKEVQKFVNEKSPYKVNIISNYEQSVLKFKTLEGIQDVHQRDYIIRGVKGECYPMSADKFNEIYTPLEEEGGSNSD